MNDLDISKVLNEPKSDFEKLILAQRYIKQLKEDIKSLQKTEGEVAKPYKVEIGKLVSYIEELEDENKKLKHLKSIKEPITPIIKEVVKLEMSKMTPEERIYLKEKGYLQQIETLNKRLSEHKDDQFKHSKKKRQMKLEFDAKTAEMLNVIFQLRKQLDERGN